MNQLLDNRYEILKKLHETNLSITFQGKDIKTATHRLCLIKQLKTHPQNTKLQQELEARFQQEAKTLENLGTHPQIPDSYAYFSENNQLYLVQEWIAGYNLEQKFQQQGKLTETEVKNILIKLLPVLEFIHRQHNIIHRDIKPTNIMLNSENLPMLIDFGIVKEIVSSINSQIPRNSVVGTPGFTPPEQILGKPTFASDIYSLGTTAIYLLTGEIPKNKFSWRSNVPNISQEFADILDKSIAENWSDRYQTATEMLTAISSPKTKLQITTTQPSLDPNLGNNQCLKIGIIVIIIGIISTATVIFYNNKNETPPTVTPTQEITEQEMLDAAIQKAEIAISKAKAAPEKEQLEIARDELQIAIQELENIPQNPEIDNQIQTKKSEYVKVINQINQALEKQPCYEAAWNCQEYPVKLDYDSFN
ncbi:serine/threonine-protein kinase [Okeania sp. SIO3I5]|uniref:serine/threonine-protein kinase n=1 Tax=Okeania sp. SIO3I5 TaxID=2607805 RepID=UPI0025DDCF23|nr:serine/threonine-protein kinase [Okeania sp. SIO3I5]